MLKNCNGKVSAFVTQSSFLKGKKILNEVQIVNEVVDDVYKNNQELIMFNDDFEKSQFSGLIVYSFHNAKMNFRFKWMCLVAFSCK